MTERICFTLSLDPSLIDEYVQAHRAVWPDMLAAIERSGRRNYSIFIDEDGTVVGYYETDDDEASARILSLDPIAAKWEAQSARFFVGLDGRPDEGARQLRPVFNLEQQLHEQQLNELGERS
ncbi:L-rhamnose mutarotase [Humibacter albus]|uniref:L-rhamnose mutarotase n=1 Tax=Humibacter albus TaxID=427754 RepID=UPI0003B76F38|nr:L-rhamnose mutarotase [Humibacter albus]